MGVMRCPPPSKAERVWLAATLRRMLAENVLPATWPLPMEPGHDPLAGPFAWSPAIAFIDEHGHVVDEATAQRIEASWARGELRQQVDLRARWHSHLAMSLDLVSDWRLHPIPFSSLGFIPPNTTLDYLRVHRADQERLDIRPNDRSGPNSGGKGKGKGGKPTGPVFDSGVEHGRGAWVYGQRPRVWEHLVNGDRQFSWNAMYESCPEPYSNRRSYVSDI